MRKRGTAWRPWGRGTVRTPPNPDVSIPEPNPARAMRSPVLTTDRNLHTGAEPSHIDRIKGAMLYGYTGPRQINSQAEFQMGRAYLGHVPLVHAVKGPAPDYGISIDDRAYIPSFPAGDPV